MSYHTTKRVCEVFNGTTNCRVHTTTCSSCKSGFSLNWSTRQCIQTCDQAECSVCVRADISLCVTCASGYSLNLLVFNNITHEAVCVRNPCNITNCSLCGPGGVGCVKCATKYLVYNSSSDICEDQCTVSNCRDCVMTGANAGVCDFCDEGYCLDYETGVCVECNISNCLESYVSDG